MTTVFTFSLEVNNYPLIFTSTKENIVQWGDKTWTDDFLLRGACLQPFTNNLIVTDFCCVWMVPNFYPSSKDPFLTKVMLSPHLKAPNSVFFDVDCDRVRNILLVGTNKFEIRDSHGVKLHNITMINNVIILSASMSPFSNQMALIQYNHLNHNVNIIIYNFTEKVITKNPPIPLQPPLNMNLSVCLLWINKNTVAFFNSKLVYLVNVNNRIIE